MMYERELFRGERWTAKDLTVKIFATQSDQDLTEETIVIEVKDDKGVNGGQITFSDIKQFSLFAQMISRTAANKISVMDDSEPACSEPLVPYD